jgi:hypothetical protein
MVEEKDPEREDRLEEMKDVDVELLDMDVIHRVTTST